MPGFLKVPDMAKKLSPAKLADLRCRLCGHQSLSNSDHASHITGSHDLGINGKDRLPPRPISCWRCARDVEIGHTNVCSCGFQFPFPARS